MPDQSPLTISFAESAIRDLEDVLDFYRDQQIPEIGDRLVREIVAAVEDLSGHPDRGRIVPEFNSPRLRELIHPPFRVVYRRFPEKISIVRIWRSERLLRLPG